MNAKPTMVVQKKPLLNNDNKFTPQAEEIFRNEYKGFANEDGTWGRKEAAKFTGVVLADTTIDQDDGRVKGLFDKYDTDRDGYLNVDNFMEFYLEAAQSRAKVVYENLSNLGYRVDLSKLSDEVFRRHY